MHRVPFMCSDYNMIKIYIKIMIRTVMVLTQKITYIMVQLTSFRAVAKRASLNFFLDSKRRQQAYKRCLQLVRCF